MKWIQYKFRFYSLDSHWIDLFLIDTAIRDVLLKHDIQLWRFHRRWAKDSVGHQLSFLCYVDPNDGIGIEIGDDLINHTSVKLLREYKWIKSYSTEIYEPGIEKTSDTKWSEELQESWPYFIHGASAMILHLLDEWGLEDIKEPNIKQIEQIYTAIDSHVKEHYTDQAAHAFIHHLSALFGYAPIKLNI